MCLREWKKNQVVPGVPKIQQPLFYSSQYSCFFFSRIWFMLHLKCTSTSRENETVNEDICIYRYPEIETIHKQIEWSFFLRSLKNEQKLEMSHTDFIRMNKNELKIEMKILTRINLKKLREMKGKKIKSQIIRNMFRNVFIVFLFSSSNIFLFCWCLMLGLMNTKNKSFISLEHRSFLCFFDSFDVQCFLSFFTNVRRSPFLFICIEFTVCICAYKEWRHLLSICLSFSVFFVFGVAFFFFVPFFFFGKEIVI